MRFAIVTGRAQEDPTIGLRGAILPLRVTHHASRTDPREVGELLRAIDAYDGQPTTAFALKIAPYVFVRPGELRAAEWAEFNLDNAEWRIPAARMKMRRLHIVPLARQVVELLRELAPFSRGSRYLFPSLRSPDRPISDNTINAALRRLGYTTEEQTGHGFRTMASTLLNEQGFPPGLIELQLAHEDRDQVSAAYNRAQRLDARRKMMVAWADYLDGLKAEDTNKITPIRAEGSESR
jgi:integrase